MAKRSPGLIKRGRIWHVNKTVAGVDIRESTGTPDLAEAERYLAHRIEQIRKQTIYGERPGYSFGEAVERFLREACPTKSLQRAGHALDHVLPYIGHLDVTMVHDGSLSDFRAHRLAEGAAANTINKEIMFIARILTLCARVWRHPNGRPFIDTPPLLQRVSGPAKAPTVLSWDKQRELLPHLTAGQQAAVLFALNTGLRQEELCSLQWAWRVPVPELDTFVFVLPGSATKNGQERVVVLNSIARRVVEAQQAQAEYVFLNRYGQRYNRLYNETWRVARERIGLPSLRVHDLRHTFGHRLRAAGVGLEDRADLLGHASGRMTTHYSAPELGRLLEAAESIVTERPATVLAAVGGR